MGDKKPKKNSSGTSDKHKAKEAKVAAEREAARPKGLDKKDTDRK
jgi:hypothetical protein